MECRMVSQYSSMYSPQSGQGYYMNYPAQYPNTKTNFNQNNKKSGLNTRAYSTLFFTIYIDFLHLISRSERQRRHSIDLTYPSAF